MLRRSAALTALLVLSLAGCGDDGSTDAGTGSTSDASTTAVPGVDAEADQAAAEEAIAALEAELAGMGFVAQADDGDEENDADDIEFVTDDCRRFDEAFDDGEEMEGETADAEMDSHEREADMVFEFVEASVGMTESAEQLDELFALLGDGDMGDCLAEAFRISLEEDQAEGGGQPFEVQDIGVSSGDIADMGDESAQFEISFTMVGEGLELPMTLEMLMVRDGRVAVMVMVGVGGLGGVEPSIDAEAAAQVLLDELAV